MPLLAFLHDFSFICGLHPTACLSKVAMRLVSLLHRYLWSPPCIILLLFLFLFSFCTLIGPSLFGPGVIFKLKSHFHHASLPGSAVKGKEQTIYTFKRLATQGAPCWYNLTQYRWPNALFVWTWVAVGSYTSNKVAENDAIAYHTSLHHMACNVILVLIRSVPTHPSTAVCGSISPLLSFATSPMYSA